VTLLAFLALFPGAKPRTASATANPLPALLTCPNVDGSDNNKITVSDILAIVKTFGKAYGQPGYGPLWDLVSPYNSTSPSGTGQITVADIIAVIQKYNLICPVVDTQIARATRAIGDPLYSDILCDPALTTAMNCGGDPQFLTEDVTFLAGKGYYQGSSDVPGQGVHYVNTSLWDGVFNPARPEGLVYNDGVLAAQLYVVNGNTVGWGSYSAGPCSPSCPGAVHGIDLEGTVGGPQCSPACSWDGGYDGWHVHYYLCTVHVGTSGAVAAPGSSSQSNCASFAGGEPLCTVPMTATPCYTWGVNIGWMGHLWNWLPNANLIPDIGTTGQNGRFADCFPDGGSWGPFDCPA
jgi:hypothetical protein